MQRNSSLAKAVAGCACALAVAGYFLYAAQDKIGPKNAKQFAIDIKNYKILPERYVNLPAIILPWIEVAAALALVFPRTRPSSALLISGMLLAFIGAMGYSALYLGLDISCGCAGEGSGKAGWVPIWRNIALLVGTMLSVALLPCQGSKDACAADSPTAGSPDLNLSTH